MDAIASILRNTAVLMGAKAVSAALGLGLVAVLPRLLGDAEYGRLHLAIALVGMVGVAVDFGLTQVLARAVARDHGLARAYLRRAGVLTLALGAVFYGGLLGLLTVVRYPAGTELVVAILGIGMVLDALAELLSGTFQGHERMLVPALARVTGNVLTLGLLLPRLWSDAPTDATVVARVLIVSSLARLALQAWGVRALDGVRAPRPADLPWRGLLAAGLPFVMWQALGILYFRIDVLMLGHMTPPATVGWYGAASRLVDGLTFIADAIAITSYPVMARLWGDAPGEFRQVLRRTFAVLLVVTVPIVVGLAVLAPRVVDVLFSTGFENTGPILRIHAFTLGLLFVDYLLATLLMAIGRERAWLIIAASACVLNPALNWVAIPATQAWYGNGGIGAALATLATEICVTLSALALAPRGALARISVRAAAGLALAGLVMAGVIGGGLALEAPWLLAGALGGLAYLGLVLRLGLVPEDVVARVRAAATWRSPREVLP